MWLFFKREVMFFELPGAGGNDIFWAPRTVYTDLYAFCGASDINNFLNMLAYFIWMYFLNTLQERISLSLPLQTLCFTFTLVSQQFFLPFILSVTHTSTLFCLSFISFHFLTFVSLVFCFICLFVSFNYLLQPFISFSLCSSSYPSVFSHFPKSSRLTDKNFFEESVSRV